MAAFAATTSIANHIVIDVDAHLDVAALSDAWQLLGRRHPILRARADLERDGYWRIDDALPPVGVAEEPTGAQLEGPGPAERLVVSELTDHRAGGLSRLAVVSRGSGQRLIWTGSHAQMDGSSAAAVVADLAVLYGAVVAGQRPSTALDDRPGDLDTALADVGLDGLNRALVVSRATRRWARLEPSTHPEPRSSSPAAGYGRVDVTEALSALDHLRRARVWRTSAVLIALLARAWDRVFDDGVAERPASGWQIAGNLRPHLRSDLGVGNLSGTDPITLHHVGDRPLVEVVDEANRQLAHLESGWPGLGTMLMTAALSSMPAATSALAVAATLRRIAAIGYGRAFSNVGVWPPHAERWGDAAMVGSFFVPAMSHPDWITVMAYGQAGRSHLSLRTHEVGVGADDLARLGEAMTFDARAAGLPVGPTASR